MQAHGFGMMGRGVGYYALTSTLALLHWLLERRRDDTMYQGALAATAEKVGAAGMHGLISATSQARVAMGAAGDAWREATEVASHLDTAEPGADVLAACHANGINYGQLVADASRRLAETATATRKRRRTHRRAGSDCPQVLVAPR